MKCSDVVKPRKSLLRQFFFPLQEIVQYSDAFADEVGESDEAKDGTVRDTSGENDAIEETQEEISEEKVTDKGAAEAQSIEKKGEEGEEMSVDEAAENLAIPIEPEKRAANQRTETYYYYQCEWKLNL